MSSLVKKSVFVEQTIVARKYFVVNAGHYRWHDGPYIQYDEPIITGEVFKQIDIPMPLLKVGDSFYFEDEKAVVKIEKVMRTDKDSVMYVINTNRVVNEEDELKYQNDLQAHIDVEKTRQEERDAASKVVKALAYRGLISRIFNHKVDGIDRYLRKG